MFHTVFDFVELLSSGLTLWTKMGFGFWKKWLTQCWNYVKALRTTLNIIVLIKAIIKMLTTGILLCLSIFTGFTTISFPNAMNLKVTSNSGYIDYYEGTLNIILAAPHGGDDKPSSIPDRDAGCYDPINNKCIWSHDCGSKDFDRCKATTVNDFATKDLALRVREQLFVETGAYPHVVINNLHRLKLDANRDKSEATFGEEIPEQAWEEFHGYIDSAKTSFHNRAIFIDIHGHPHKNNWAELGYLISGSQLDSGNFYAERTSIRHVASQVCISFNELLRGPSSFGGFIQNNGFDAIPSPRHPAPNGRGYFSGGYNTRRHGSMDGTSRVDAIQIESSNEQRSEGVRPAYARALAKSLKSFLDEYHSE